VLAALPTKPASPSIILKGTVASKVYNYVFYSSGIVQINSSLLSPKKNVFTGFLNDGTFCGLFTDGLHIGRNLIPYPPQFAPLLAGLALPGADLLEGLSLDDLGKRK
jgi:hypothetical protein